MEQALRMNPRTWEANAELPDGCPSAYALAREADELEKWAVLDQTVLENPSYRHGAEPWPLRVPRQRHAEGVVPNGRRPHARARRGPPRRKWTRPRRTTAHLCNPLLQESPGAWALGQDRLP